jgi:trehalose 6-phosphate synthase/phosphatase
VLPTRRWLLEGVLGADLVGFHTAAYRDHFREAVRRFLPEVPVGEVGDPDTLRVGGRVVRLGVFPMGVDAAALAAHAETPEVAAETARIRAPGLRLLVGVDRLDYSKGIPRRLLSFEQLLLRHPEWRERVRLVQVAVPSRVGVAEYQHFREQLDALVGRINGAFGTPTWTPIHYMYRAVDETTLLALYRAADVMLVTPVRDGMNLVAKEFVAARGDGDGVLVLSEFAGAAAELTDALLVNPYDVHGTADAMHGALTMPGPERARRIAALRARVAGYDAARWAGAFLHALGAARPDAVPPPDPRPAPPPDAAR